MRLRLSQRAANDLEDLAAYLFARSPQAADHVQQQLTETLQLIADHPQAGRTVEGRRRRFAVPRLPYPIFYRVDELAGVVNVLHIRHGARRPEETP